MFLKSAFPGSSGSIVVSKVFTHSASGSRLLRQLCSQSWRIDRDILLHPWTPLHRQPNAGVRGMEVDLELIKRAAAAPQIQPLCHINQRSPRRIDAKRISIVQVARGSDRRNHTLSDVAQLLPLLRGEGLQITSNRWNA